MQRRTATVIAVCLAAAAVALMLAFGGKEESKPEAAAVAPGEPAVEIISPRNGARQNAHAVVVRVNVQNFHLAPAQFGHDPQLDEGHLRFSLNRVPNCVYPKKLEKAENSPIGTGRLKGNSFDFPRYSGPNGVLAEQVGTTGSYSPATRPEIYYHGLPPGFYRLVVTLAQNNGAPMSPHDVTNFQILQKPGHHMKPCPKGKVSSSSAAEKIG
ncbi:MAG: hypothetical protein JST31_14575 [Actinobacteria bacterium]|nr:hypothetical protein [Actinomycetota bacterium]